MIILTGGAGFIGSVVLWRLNQAGIDDVLVVDRLGTHDKWKNLVGKRFRMLVTPEGFLANVQNRNVGSADVIIHLGACTNTTERDADYLAENNFRYSARLAEFALEREIPFIYASSASVYGDGRSGYRVGTTASLRPLNAYAMSKYLFDCWIEQRALLERVTGLRFFNVFGPNEYHKGAMASMAYKAFLQIQQSGKVKLFASTSPDYADGEQKRDFVYVKDVAEIIWRLVEAEQSAHPIRGIYNVGSGCARSWNELVGTVFSVMQQQPMIEYIPMPEELRPQYQNFTQADMQPLAEAFGRHGWSLPLSSLQDAIGDYVGNYLLQSWQYL
ncbi:MAG: ADP-L-glycero-D-manno-heptose-6-epimerase [Candidatus Kapaibacterium sp.]|nr:MAG: ADP-L-glycero-D-manno-heptose-6-epimerase [Candidatus Kapabacteria bacterium]